MRNKILALLCGLSMMAANNVTVMAGADDHNYTFYVESDELGYNSSVVNKTAVNDKARVYVSNTYKKL